MIVIIQNLKELKKIVQSQYKKNETPSEFRLLLNGGVFTRYSFLFNPKDKKPWWVFQFSCNAEEYLTEKQFKKRYPLIFKAFKKSGLIWTSKDNGSF